MFSRSVILFALLATIAACGGGAEPAGPPPPAPVASVTVDPSTASLPPGGTQALSATTRDASGNVLSGRTISWSSSNASLVSVTTSGVVTAVAAGGPVTITATSEGRSGSSSVTVIAPVASVSVTPPTSTLSIGGTVALTATTLDATSTPLVGRQVTWTSSSPTVASVSNNGLVTALAAGGPVTITATSEGKIGTSTVTVLAPVATVTVSPPSTTLAVGATLALTATAFDASSSPLAGRVVTWSSSNPSVASVSSGGVVTGVAPGGPVTIIATSEGRSGTASIVVQPPVTSVVVTGSTSAKVGDAYTYTATARIADGSIVVRPVSWSVTDPSRAQMTANGTLTPLLAGTITIRATIDNTNWIVSTTAYDWVPFGSGTTHGVTLAADNTITNKFGQSEYPDLFVGCASGQLLTFVRTQRFVTANGGVSYRFDGGPITSTTWVESSDFRSLIFPSLSNQVNLGFGALMSVSRTFDFAFTEFQSGARAIRFRVTGLGPRLAAFQPSCQLLNNSVATEPSIEAVTRLLDAAGRSLELSPDALQRRRSGPVAASAPRLDARSAERQTRTATREPR